MRVVSIACDSFILVGLYSAHLFIHIEEDGFLFSQHTIYAPEIVVSLILVGMCIDYYHAHMHNPWCQDSHDHKVHTSLHTARLAFASGDQSTPSHLQPADKDISYLTFTLPCFPEFCK
jgi:hypothetical protein